MTTAPPKVEGIAVVPANVGQAWRKRGGKSPTVQTGEGGASIMSDQLRSMVEEIDRLGEDLTPWEIEYIAGIIDKNTQTFSTKQADIIRRIYEERIP